MTKIDNKYKHSEIGIIPDTWEVKSLSQISAIKRGASPRPINSPIWFDDNSGIGWIRISDATRSGKYLLSTEQYLSDEGISKSKPVHNNDLILSICATIGKPIILRMDACIHDGFVVFEQIDKREINIEYLYYVLLNQKQSWSKYGQPGAQINLNTGLVGNVLVAIPSLPEQIKIADILSTVDEQIEHTDALIEKTKELKKGLMQQLLTRGIGHTRFKQTELGEIPEEWEVKSLEQLCNVLDSQRIPINSQQRMNMKGNIPYYGANGIVDYVNDYIFNDNLILLAEDGGNFEDYQNRPIAMLVKGMCWVNNHAHVLKPKNESDLEWIFYNIVHKDITSYIKGGTRSKLNQKDMREIPIAYSKNAAERRLITEILDSVDTDISNNSALLRQLYLLKQGLMQKLLTGQIRVKLS